MDTSPLLCPAFRITREPEGLRIRVPVKPDRFGTLLNFVWLLVWAAGELAILLFLLGVFHPAGTAPTLPVSFGVLFLAAFTAAGGATLWRWLWRMGGREIFLVTRSGLWARREIWGLGRTRKFEVEEIRSVKARRLQYRIIYPSWGRMFIGDDAGQVVIKHAGRAYAYGKGLEEGEAGDLAELLKDELGLDVRRRLPFPGEFRLPDLSETDRLPTAAASGPARNPDAGTA